MRLAGCRTGDLVKVDDGLPFYAEVLEPPAGRRVRVRPLHGSRHPRNVGTRDVVAHWRKAGARATVGASS